MNLCSGCDSGFSSVKLFERHRVGTHEYDWSFRRPEGDAASRSTRWPRRAGGSTGTDAGSTRRALSVPAKRSLAWPHRAVYGVRSRAYSPVGPLSGPLSLSAYYCIPRFMR